MTVRFIVENFSSLASMKREQTPATPWALRLKK